jgi:hypothetical protein
MVEEGLPDFVGKAVFIQLPAEGYSWMLTGARFEKQGGDWVLLGKPLVDEESHWARAGTVGVRWEYVAYYVIFDSVEDVRQRLTEPPAASEKAAEPSRGWLSRRRGS